MNQARGDATATLLPNGEVLIAGGLVAGGLGSTVLASTELHDSATNTIVPGPSMNVARQLAGATLLPSGKVLIAGGSNSGALSSTEIYDPSANSFTAGPSMSVAENLAQATLLPNGKVLITGDAVSGGVSVAELYDPAGNKMSERVVNSYRQFATAVLLPNGKVLVAGGLGDPTSGQVGSLKTTEIYDSAQEAFVDGPSMSTGRWEATAVPLANGDVAILGGVSGSTSLFFPSDVEIYDPSKNSFSQDAPLNEPRFVATATLLANGSAFVAGGFNGTNQLSSTEIYIP